MEDSKFAEVLSRLAEHSIGLDLVQTKPRYSTEEYERLRQQALDELDTSNMKDDEHVVEGFSLTTGKPTFTIEKKPLKYEECSWNILTDDDWNIIESITDEYGLNRNSTDKWESSLMVCASDPNLFTISTSQASWFAFCGRAWLYDRSTHTIKLIRMN